MKKAILAKKVGMTQIFDENGVLTPVTVLQAGPCVVTQIKTVENDGYDAIQVGFGEKKERVTTKDVSGKKVIRNPHGAGKAEVGHAKKAGTTPKTFYREFRLENTAEYELGARSRQTYLLLATRLMLLLSQRVRDTQAVLRDTALSQVLQDHGSKYHRHAGSNGSATTPGRVFKGKKMPGHMGNVRVTIQNLEVVKIDVENNVILVKGAVPGPKKSLVMIKDTVKSGK